VPLDRDAADPTILRSILCFLLPAARMEQFKGFHSVVEGLAREARAVERG
jgi:hypothetical protein